LSVLNIQRMEIKRIAVFLEAQLAQSGDFLKFAPLILQLTALDDAPDTDQLTALMSILREKKFIPCGLICTDAVYEDIGEMVNLPHMGKDYSVTSSRSEKTAQVDWHPAQIIDKPVRSGQQIYARKKDLIVLGQVSEGAEVIADGSIHVYGTLRGKAIAGAGGRHESRLYVQDFRPELIAIAGHYRIFEDQQEALYGKSVTVKMNGEEIRILPTGS